MRQIILSQKEITEITRKFGQMFTDMFKDDPLPPIFIGVMKGAVPFMIDLVREIDCPVLLDFMQVSSYLGTESTGIISLKKDVSLDIRNRNVVIVEDIIDSGYTMNWLKNYLEKTYCPKKLLTLKLTGLSEPFKSSFNPVSLRTNNGAETLFKLSSFPNSSSK